MKIAPSINLQYLAGRIAEQCPLNYCQLWTLGYQDFLKCYFEALQSYYDLLYLDEDKCAEVDLELVLESTLSALSGKPSYSIAEYKSGIEAAFSKSKEVLELAFTFNPIFQVA